ncbi:P-loop containing nucleoside triphosphate hydrolase protein [Mycena pura]|uniref:P-loop containing nucleoside triphosphate hydrolase protein n=1 Tax=Mycena pura TaxID=153505 RepID=A0AAD6V033_9AGAR|nr:P-loop containing nucleoside triphosphate hydrolase protein [Mycena pura]
MRLFSSTSISMLPSEPKIFHGRESDLSHILRLFTEGIPRIAILGAGGMGKSSLARAVLHHSDISLKYQDHRLFVSCDSASTKGELVSLIGTHLGLKPGKGLARQIVRHLSHGPPCLLILDNLETAWEPTGSRPEIEEYLSLLTDIQHLALIITMRGSERPDKVSWSRPFLPPLQPLAQEAARKAFIDIADDETHDSDSIDKVLLLTDNMPLAIDLMAHLVDSEGCAAVLSRWEEERTSLFSRGYDKRSNLDMSIALSLASPRIASVPYTRDLLILLSILPDGLSDTQLLQSKFPIDNILRCKSVLIRTSLAYNTSQNRLKVLVPIREHIHRYYPPNLEIVEPLFQNYREILELWQKHEGTWSAEMVHQIAINSANIQNILSFRIVQGRLDRSQTIYCGINLSQWSRAVGQGMIPFMASIPQYLPQPVDHRLEVSFIIESIISSWFWNTQNAETLIEQAVAHFPYFDDSNIKCKSFNQCPLVET